MDILRFDNLKDTSKTQTFYTCIFQEVESLSISIVCTWKSILGQAFEVTWNSGHMYKHDIKDW
jgi:hypothetical protein